jgi:hypothetical protein
MTGTPGTSGTYVGSGTLTLSAKSFTTACEGIGSSPGAICRAGKVTAAATTTASLNGTGTTSDINFSATPIAGFEVIVE